MNNDEDKRSFKIIAIGDINTGKTRLTRYFTDIHDSHTLNVFVIKKVQLRNKVEIIGQFWDTYGQERFCYMPNLFYRNTDGAFLVYDITSMNSFKHVVNVWMNQLKEKTDRSVVIMLIGNKLDLEHNREVPVEMAAEFAYRNNILFLETSSLNGTNVNLAFQSILHDVYNMRMAIERKKQKEKKSIENPPLNNNICNIN